MYGFDYEIIECNIRILNVKLDKINIHRELLFLDKPYKFMKKKYDLWQDSLNKLLDEEINIQNELRIEYQKIEKLLSAISQ